MLRHVTVYLQIQITFGKHNFQLSKNAEKYITSSKFKSLHFSHVHPKPKFKSINVFQLSISHFQTCFAIP